MKRRNTMLAIIIFVLYTLTGCGYEETQECELLTIRMFTVESESGIFTTKTEDNTYIEISYKTKDGIETCTCYTSDVEVSDETKVVEKKGDLSPTIYLTPKDYNDLYGLK